MKLLAGLLLVIIFHIGIFSILAQERDKPKISAEAGIALLRPEFAIAKSKHPAALEIIARAKEALNLQPEVIDIRVEGVSLGKTSANIQNPSPVKANSQENVAKVDTSFIKKPQKEGSSNDLNTSLDLALAWRLTGERRFLDQAGKYIDSWANYNLTFNPINEGKFSLLILAYDLTEKDLSDSIRAKMNDFCQRLASGYLDGMETGNVEIPQTLTNNWQSHRIELATLAAFQSGETKLIDRAHQVFNKHITVNLKPDGSTLDFLQRGCIALR